MIVFDTETTGLIGHVSTPLDQQPEIIELTAFKLDDATLEKTDEISFLIAPKRLPLPPKITEITGITENMLKGQPSFARHLPAVRDFFRGEETMVAHNCSYDAGMFELELRRLSAVTKFPWPSTHICTVEATMSLKGYRLKLGILYELLTGKKPDGAHRSRADVAALAELVPILRGRGLL